MGLTMRSKLKETVYSSSDEFDNAGSGLRCPVAFNIAVQHFSANFLGDRGCDDLGCRLLKIHTATSPVAFQPMSHVEVLLEMMSQGKIQERPLGCSQLHRSGQSALHHRHITNGEVSVQLVDIGAHFESLHFRQRL